MPTSSVQNLNYATLREAVCGHAAAFRCVTDYQPAGGPGDKVFPATYEGGSYATEERRIDGEIVPCVLIDSVQSQANRMELALLDAWERGPLRLPVITVDFAGAGLPSVGRVTSLEAPHRIADAILRDSLLENVPFRQSDQGKALDDVSIKNATTLLEMCPTALILGMWDSTGPRGGMGAKFARAMVSEIVGLHAQPGKRTSSRIDPLQIMLQAGPLYQGKDGSWTLNETEALVQNKVPVKLGKDGKPSEANHGNVTPSIADGGFTISKAVRTTVLSLAALRRLRFPLNGEGPEVATDDAARTMLAALGLCAAALADQNGCDLRSRCHLVPTQTPIWELVDRPGEPVQTFTLLAEEALKLLKVAVDHGKQAGLPWQDEGLVLTPMPQLVELVRRTHELAAVQSGEKA